MPLGRRDTNTFMAHQYLNLTVAISPISSWLAARNAQEVRLLCPPSTEFSIGHELFISPIYSLMIAGARNPRVTVSSYSWQSAIV